MPASEDRIQLKRLHPTTQPGQLLDPGLPYVGPQREGGGRGGPARAQGSAYSYSVGRCAARRG